MAKKEKPATTQAEYDKAYEEVKSGKQPVPSFDDMGPFPHRTGLKMLSKEEYEKLPKMKDLPEQAIEFPNVKKDEKGRVIYKKKGGAVKKMAKGGSVGSASKRADGCATKGKTKGRII
jgi:hypothetical protein